MARTGTSGRTDGTVNAVARTLVRPLTGPWQRLETVLTTVRDGWRARRARRLLASLGSADGHRQVRPSLE